MNENSDNILAKFLDDLIDRTLVDFNDRWDQIQIDLYEAEKYEVIGGLLSRQATLLIEMASCPPIWNGNVAPLLLRSMTDLYITFAWILGKPEERTHQYILYGLGQEKLLLEHYELSLQEKDDPEMRKMLESRKAWLESQRRDFMTEVNVGNWASIDTRKMAQEINCETLYKFAYSPFSMVAHNMWNHISRYNMTPCVNPIHKGHNKPAILDVPCDIDYLYRAIKYFDKTLHCFDEHHKVSVDSLYPLDWWEKRIESLAETDRKSN